AQEQPLWKNHHAVGPDLSRLGEDLKTVDNEASPLLLRSQPTARNVSRIDRPDELQGWKIGVGVAAGGWPGGTEPAAAACRLESDGTITVVVGTVDLTGSDTSLALIAAEGLGMPSSSVSVAHDNTDTMPYSGGTGGSKTTYSMGPAVLAAARDARNQI